MSSSRASAGADLFLPAGYQENPPNTADVDGAGYWDDPVETRVRNARRYQDRVYRYAARLARQRSPRLVVDIGCGTGANLVHRVGTVTKATLGVDQPSAIALAERSYPDRRWLAADLRSEAVWAELGAFPADLVICADVIEHVDDPRELLRRLHALAGPDGAVVLSTPDRARVEDAPALGPPRNVRHVREWTEPELRALVEAAGFSVRAARHALPRRYPPSVLEAKMLAWRALRRRPLPGPRSCLVLELSPVRRTSDSTG